MEINIVVNEEKINLNFIDNNAKDTLVCIHGFYSNKNFIGELPNLIKSFNIVSFSYGDLKNMDYNYILEIIKKIIFKHLKRTKIHILAHSMGALFASDIGKSKKIQSINFINPIHPYIFEYNRFKLLVKYIQMIENASSKTKLFHMSTSQFQKMVPKQIYKFINTKSKWYDVIKKIVINENMIQKYFKNNLIFVKHKSKYVISKIDKIISQKNLKIFLNDIKKEYTVIDSEDHSILLSSKCIDVANNLNYIKFRKRSFFNRKIFKK